MGTPGAAALATTPVTFDAPAFFTFESLWRIGPFEDAAATGIRAVLAGDRIVVACGAGRIATDQQPIRSTTGEETASVQTQHRFTDARVGPPPRTQTWFETSFGAAS